MDSAIIRVMILTKFVLSFAVALVASFPLEERDPLNYTAPFSGSFELPSQSNVTAGSLNGRVWVLVNLASLQVVTLGSDVVDPSANETEYHSKDYF